MHTINDCSRHDVAATMSGPTLSISPSSSTNRSCHQYTGVVGDTKRSSGDSPLYDEIDPRHNLPRFKPSPRCPSVKPPTAKVAGHRQTTDYLKEISSIYLHPGQSNANPGDDELVSCGELSEKCRPANDREGVSNSYEAVRSIQPTISETPGVYAELRASSPDCDVTGNLAVGSTGPPIYCVTEVYGNFEHAEGDCTRPMPV